MAMPHEPEAPEKLFVVVATPLLNAKLPEKLEGIV